MSEEQDLVTTDAEPGDQIAESLERAEQLIEAMGGYFYQLRCEGSEPGRKISQLADMVRDEIGYAHGRAIGLRESLQEEQETTSS